MGVDKVGEVIHYL